VTQPLRTTPRLVLTAILFPLLLALLAGCSADAPDQIPAPVDEATLARGAHLVRGLAACGVCHGEKPDPDAPLSGGRTHGDMYGRVAAANITPARSGIGEWSAAEVIRAVRGSINRRDERLSSASHRGYEWMSDEDLLSVVAWVRALPPVENEVPRRTLSFIERNTTGFFDVKREVRGYVPAIDPSWRLEYGRYLTDHVARCGSCHNSPGGLLKEAEYLMGGDTIEMDGEEKIAPAITNSRGDGLGAWSEEQIVHYLKSGQLPSGPVTDARFCPTGFYRNAAPAELRAIAAYLKSLPE